MEIVKTNSFLSNNSNVSSAPVALEMSNENLNLNNINNLNITNKNDISISNNNLIIQITPFYIDKLQKDCYINIIQFIMNNCDIILKKNFFYKNNNFIIKKKKSNYKLSINKEVKNKIKDQYEKKIIEQHKEIVKINENFDDINIKNEINDDSSIENAEFYCQIHDKTYYTKQAYNNHLRSQHNYKFKCLKCGEKFQTIIKVQNHFSYCNKNNKKNNELFKNDNNKSKININTNNKNDEYINKKDNNMNSINIDNDIMNNNLKKKQKKKQEDPKKINDIKLNNKKEKEKEGSSYYYECYRDGKTFEEEKEYIKHFKKYHPNDFPFYCDKCDRGFYSYNAIENHILSMGHT